MTSALPILAAAARPRAIRLLGWTHVALGGLYLSVGAFACVGLALSHDPRVDAALPMVAPLFLMGAVAYPIPALIAGAGLLRGAAWARWATGILSVLIAPLFPFGSALGGVGLWVLLRTPPASAPGQPPALPGPGLHGPWGLVAAMAAVGGGFVLVLALGFRLHDQSIPEGLAEAVFPALGLMVLALAAFFARPPAFARPPRRVVRTSARDLGQDRATRMEARRLRLAGLAADPATARYVPLIEAGESWSDAQIDYDLDPDRLVTCRHLQPVERALRRSGVKVRLRRGPEVDADCRVDPAGFAAIWRPPATVVYNVIELGGRAYEDPPHAFLACTTCWSWIHVRHPLEATLATPWFPAPPSEA